MTGFDADDLIACYRRGVFPMADARHDERLFLVEPARRAVIPPDGLRISRRLARTLRSGRFEMRVDTSFAEVIAACAAPRPGRMETWINRTIETLCLELFARGLAHSVEAWRGGRLVGGLYGIALGGAFFGESMFSLEADASKAALAHLAARLAAGGYRLLDAQFMTGHLQRMGAVEISKTEYRRRLADALSAGGEWRALEGQAPGGATGRGAAGAAGAVHDTSQAS